MNQPSHRRALGAAWVLLATQVVHGFIPSETHTHSVVGPVVGLVFLIATIVAIVGLARGRSFATRLLRMTGAAIAVGFVLYHVLPWKTPMTRPYIGEPVGVPAWIGVAVAVAAGIYAATVAGPLPRTGDLIAKAGTDLDQ